MADRIHDVLCATIYRLSLDFLLCPIPLFPHLLFPLRVERVERVIRGLRYINLISGLRYIAEPNWAVSNLRKGAYS